ncbi:MAG TPA: DUF192 domain-containing protein [Nitrososphaera sp.]
MRTITIVAIAAAAAAGIIAIAIMYVNPSTLATSEPETKQQDLAVGVATLSNNGFRQVKITVNGVDLVADIAETGDQQSKGLSVKDILNENEAMLFPFKKEGQHTFWMKGMKFPIDIIWIDSYKEVVHIEHSLDPCVPNSFCPTYTPSERSFYVLETAAGFAAKYNVTEGTPVEFELDE